MKIQGSAGNKYDYHTRYYIVYVQGGMDLIDQSTPLADMHTSQN